MKIGPLHVTWLTARRAALLKIEIYDELRSPEARSSIARVARGEVKNYLADLAEGADMPFPSAAGFLRRLKTMIGETSATNYAESDDESDEPADDYPFSVIETLPNGHTTTCTCANKYNGIDTAICAYCGFKVAITDQGTTCKSGTLCPFNGQTVMYLDPPRLTRTDNEPDEKCPFGYTSVHDCALHTDTNSDMPNA
jgi:hypothetical protein